MPFQGCLMLDVWAPSQYSEYGLVGGEDEMVAGLFI